MPEGQVAPNHARTGIEGLDDILGGGLTPNRLYLLEGKPGSGKTTLAFQFLMEGVRQGERVLYVTLSETEEEIRAVALTHGWSFQGIDVRELVPDQESLEPEEQYTMFHPSEVELSDTTRKILDDVARIKPSRLVFDSLSELRLLAGSPLRYRRQILALKHHFAGRRCTVLLLDDMTGDGHDLQVQSIAHGVVLLQQITPDYGKQRRRLSVLKYRGKEFRGGYHDYIIRRGGLEVFPRLIAAEHEAGTARNRLTSGLVPLDQLLGGGLDRGTSTLITGAAGTGKSSIAGLFAHAAAEAGEVATLFLFDENQGTLLDRMEALGVDLRQHLDQGRIIIRQVDPAEWSPGEFSNAVRLAVSRDRSALVIVDSLNGYLHSMPQERFLIIQLHEILTYLGRQGVATILINAQIGLVGQMKSDVDASYLADAVILTRYYELDGEVRMAVSVVKKRGSQHERTIRELSLRSGRISVGAPLRGYHGVLTGVPTRVPPPRDDALGAAAADRYLSLNVEGTNGP
ncbi:MAG TPA: ATPase domain-containing protein [Lautropia sp.]|nr:ATPase domain-containing protein [Lautropia sp.]